MKDTNDMRKLINEMKEMMYEPTLTLESFLIPEEIGQEPQDYPAEEETDTFSEVNTEQAPPQQETMPDTPMEQQNDYSDIQKEIIQIRKIALSVITRLADNPSSESYDLMKKIWNMIDKVNDNKNEFQKK